MALSSSRWLLMQLLLLSSSSPLSSADDEECGIYMAVSSTSRPGETHWGLYAGHEIPAVSSVPGLEIGIHMEHMLGGAYDSDGEVVDDLLLQTIEFLETFIWVPDPAGSKYETLEGKPTAAIAGAGAIGGFNARLTNSFWNHSLAYLRPTLGETPGQNHPNRGSLSPYYNIGLQSSQKIPAGSEIFLDYGENWEDDDKEHSLTADDYIRIDQTIAKMLEFFAKHPELDDDASQRIYLFLTKDVMTAAIGSQKARKVQSILPHKPHELKRVPEAGGLLAYSDPAVYRQIDWLRKFGRCADTIVVQASTIPNAGRGAVATRAIPQGGLVASTPLVHLPAGKQAMELHEMQLHSDGDYVRKNDEIIGQQLMMNYVYGHAESDVLLFPVGLAVHAINHNGQAPNAKLIWSTHPNFEKSWLEKEPDDLIDDEDDEEDEDDEVSSYLGLVMDIVATRDIAPGEEVFLDYGPEWQAAWDAHVASFDRGIQNGSIPKDWPLQAVNLNDHFRDRPHIPQDDPTRATVIPDGVHLKAYLMVAEDSSPGTLESPKTWASNNPALSLDMDSVFDLDVVQVQADKQQDKKKKDDDDTEIAYYTIRWTNNKGKFTFVQGVPHSKLFFVDAPGTQRQNKPFRHWIGVPSEIFPAAWKHDGGGAAEEQ